MRLQAAVLFCLCFFCNHGARAVVTYEALVVKQLPHSRQDFTQGLEIRDGKLYQGTGGYGQSEVQVFDLASGKLLQRQELPRQLFGEGITLLQDKLVQLTWRAGIARVYQQPQLQLVEEFPLPGEGWGLTNDGERLIYSDGSEQLHFLAANSWQHISSLTVRHLGQPLRNLNELEWTPDYILANVWRSNWIVMIDEASGNVIGRIDLRTLLSADQRRPDTDVLNGIARDPDTGALWVTGKNWPWLFQIELRVKK